MHVCFLIKKIFPLFAKVSYVSYISETYHENLMHLKCKRKLTNILIKNKKFCLIFLAFDLLTENTI